PAFDPFAPPALPEFSALGEVIFEKTDAIGQVVVLTTQEATFSLSLHGGTAAVRRSEQVTPCRNEELTPLRF
ncbi:hypothetical protein, partial [Gluconacetobacter sacchari]|uniref:hypothetical protein n=1 Tax=Gluconacetobacter sacchari TaxID=92759 RepID=UPI0022304670